MNNPSQTKDMNELNRDDGVGGSSPTPSKDMETRINEVLTLAESKTSDPDPVVHILWLVQGLDLYHRSGGKMGHSLKDCQRFVASQIIRGFVPLSAGVGAAPTHTKLPQSGSQDTHQGKGK